MDIQEIQKIIQEIEELIKAHGFKIKEGSSSPEELLYLSRTVKRYNAHLVGEIGFHLGFSSFIFLQTIPEMHVISFDIGEYDYVKIAKKFIDEKFPNRHTLIYGDSKKTVPKFKKENPGLYFDFVLIDGGHDYKTAKTDIENMKMFSTKNTMLVMDDLTPWLQWGKGPTKAWTEALQEGIIIQKELFKDGKPVSRIAPPGERSWALGKYVFK